MQTEIDTVLNVEYTAGFSTEVDYDLIPKGLTEATVRLISAKRREPEFLLNWRLAAFAHWQTLAAPSWAKLNIKPIDYQDMIYYAAPLSVSKSRPQSLAEVDPKLLQAYEKLGVPLHERAQLAGVAVDAVFDSVSVATTFKEQLRAAGVIFCSFSEALEQHPELIRQYLGTVVPYTDNFFACLNAAVFTDGSFCYIPAGVRCPMELSTYFRINSLFTGQFERTLIIAEPGSYVSYLEGCTAPIRREHQLHAAVVELVALERAEIKYSTVQNWYPGDAHGEGGIYNFVTKRGRCAGAHAKISWTQIETGSAITWKYPSVILQGDHSVGEFYSIAVTNNHQQADTGTKMVHLGKHTKSTIISKGISAGHGQNTYRGLVRIIPKASHARNYTQCDSLILGTKAGAHTFPDIQVANPTALVEHEATTRSISPLQLLYCQQRGIGSEAAYAMLVTGFCKQILQKLPLEFAVEAQKLMELTLEGAIG
jgi:Fe-S cluster assembly protein SufB